MKNVHRINGKIYITNNQKLRHGFDQCYLNKKQNRPIISQRPQYVYDECLIVLTDDECLINEGIQSIDGKSLEWLVENKRCEYVNIESTLISREFHKPDVIFHKIILPIDYVLEKLFQQAKEMENDYKLKNQLFKGKVMDIIGWDKTLELLKECENAFKK